ncbi:hypothetical protein HYV88_02765 [Candidatus Woesearchaeota archaeon]|nr:hypothetical protein [Candidatus Woesearchaeota archaeon]
MKLKNKRRVIIGLAGLGLLLLYFIRTYSSLVFLFVTVGVLFLFHYIDQVYNFEFPLKYYIYLFLIIVFGSILGPGEPFVLYYRWVLYDKLLHLFSPILLSAIIFYILDRLDITLKWKFLLTVSVVMSILGVFEIGEFLGDYFFNYELQGVYLYDFIQRTKYEKFLEPHLDTMLDLIFGFAGCIVYVIYKWMHLGIKSLFFKK